MCRCARALEIVMEKWWSAMLGTKLLDARGWVHSTEDVCTGKIVGLYFSAHWCPPCRGFTPALVDFYIALRNAGQPFEIVFISSDQDQASFDGYLKSMPWKAVPYADREVHDFLSREFSVSGIPTLVLLDECGDLITTDGRAQVSRGVEAFPFADVTPSSCACSAM